jgi:D-alanine transfer protein
MVDALNLKYAHLISASFTFLLTAGLLAYATTYAQSIEEQYVHALAPRMILQSEMGIALQQTAFHQPDLLVIYGSSEMIYGNTHYISYDFFQNYPTGFNVYEVAKAGATSLNIAQDLAAIGSDLRGKKVVFSFTPNMFNPSQVSSQTYAADFSLLHANALIFNRALSLETKQLSAIRMSDYPDTFIKDPILKMGVEQLACRCSTGIYLYDLVLPLGELNTWIIRIQDHWAVLDYIKKNPSLSPIVFRKSAQIDWSGELQQARTAARQYASNNPYGIENGAWTKIYARILTLPKKPGSADTMFIQNLGKSKEWTDFDLALRILKELGGKPLILSRPINGRVWNTIGISPEARKAYYDKLRTMIAPYGFSYVDFQIYDGDQYFSVDPSSHTSREGWVYVNEILDSFFHRVIR